MAIWRSLATQTGREVKPVSNPVCVEWWDAESSSGWLHPEDFKKLTPPVVKTYGVIVERNDKAIVVAQGISGKEYLGCTLIPAGMIKRGRRLK